MFQIIDSLSHLLRRLFFLLFDPDKSSGYINFPSRSNVHSLHSIALPRLQVKRAIWCLQLEIVQCWHSFYKLLLVVEVVRWIWVSLTDLDSWSSAATNHLLEVWPGRVADCNFILRLLRLHLLARWHVSWLERWLDFQFSRLAKLRNGRRARYVVWWFEFMWLDCELSRCIDEGAESFCDTDTVAWSTMWIEKWVTLRSELLVYLRDHMFSLLDPVEMFQVK